MGGRAAVRRSLTTRGLAHDNGRGPEVHGVGFTMTETMASYLPKRAPRPRSTPALPRRNNVHQWFVSGDQPLCRSCPASTQTTYKNLRRCLAAYAAATG